MIRKVPVKSAGQNHGVSAIWMRRMLFADVKVALAQLSFDNVVLVGFAEMNRHRGPNCPTLFADLMTKRVICAANGKDSSVSEGFAAELFRFSGHHRANKPVAIEMSTTYTKSVSNNFGNARVVYDKFHFIRNW
jgi:hypothetical protein